jgi:aspartate aminotransferase
LILQELKRMQISLRVQEVKPSPTLSLQARAKALKAAGEKVMSLAAGEPDFPTPEHIRRAATRALEAGHTGYAPSAGVPPLREAVRRLYEKELGLSYGDDQVVVSCGAKQCLFNAFQTLLDPGSQAVIQAPYWVSYPDQVRLCGAVPVILPAPETGFGINLEALARAVNERTRVIVLNSPCNPTGAVISGSELDEVARLALAHDLVVISDDIYDKLIFDGKKFESIVQREPRMKDRTVLVNGVSKTYAMTGWRLGYALGPGEIIAGMRKVQDQSTSNAVTFVQYAAIEALASPPEVVGKMVRAFDERRRRLVGLMNAIDGVACEMPAGTFYTFPSIAGFLKRAGKEVPDAFKLSDLLLERERVAVMPGDAFGAPGYLRISFAASLETIEEGVARIRRFLEGYR